MAATPPGRDRVVDLLRAASILLVVSGHWLIATAVRVDGDLRGTNALAVLSWLRPVTWAFQVMPVFFVVGGFANLRSLRPDAPGAVDVGTFVAVRAERLLRPTVLFAAVWLPLAAVAVRISDRPRLAGDVARIAAQPLWFLAVYVLVVLVAPLQLRAHRRNAALTLAVLAGVVVGLDALRLSEVAPGPAVLNYLAVFLFAQGMGFAYAEGRLSGVPPRVALAVAGCALGVLVALTTVGPYPVSMIGLPGQRISNMSPPTFAILVLGVAQAALLLAAHRPLSVWLQRPRAWRATIIVNLAMLTIFLWHLTALITVGVALLGLGLAVPEVGTAAWWLERPLWLAGSAAVLLGIVVVASPVERLAVAAPAPGHLARRVAGALLAVAGLAGLALAGFAEPFEAGRRDLLGLRLSPVAALAALVLGWLLARSPTRGRGQRRT